MRSKAVLFFCLFALSLSAQRDTIIDGTKYHLINDARTDTLASVWIHNAQTNSGPYLELYPNGVVKRKGIMSMAKEAGTWDEYYPDGKLRSHGMFTKGKKDGLWNFYYPDGKKYSMGNYTDGELDGLWRRWYENDSLMSRGQYWHDFCTGTWRWYYDDGKLKGYARYRAKSILKMNEGKNVNAVVIMDGKRHYPWVRIWHFYNVDTLREYYPDGQMRSRIIYDKDGKRNGESSFWYPNGKLNHNEFYSDGIPDSVWIYYCEDGTQYNGLKTENGVVVQIPYIDTNCIYPGDIVPLIQFEEQVWPVIRAHF